MLQSLKKGKPGIKLVSGARGFAHRFRIEEHEGGITLHPHKQYSHKHSLVWLHGLGDSAYGFYDVFLDPRFELVPSTCKVILPTAPERPVTLNNGFRMTSWYDIQSLVRPLDLKKNLELYNQA
jgi:phospholipase/carboxylesterase